MSYDWLVSIYGGKFVLASAQGIVSFGLAQRYLASAGSAWERAYAYTGIILGRGVRLTYGLSRVPTHPRRSLGRAARGSNLGD